MINLYIKKTIKMKKIILIILLLSCSPLFPQDNSDTIESSRSNPLEIELAVKVKETGAIGYAYCFRGDVISVLKGKMLEKKLLITAMDSLYYGLLSRAGENEILKISFVFNRANEPYSTAFVNGFVDHDKNSWRITEIQKY